MLPFVLYTSASAGSGWKYPLHARKATGSLSVEVVAGDADSGFRWAMDLESSTDGGKTWQAEQGLFNLGSGSDSDRFAVPASGLIRMVLKVEDSGNASRVFGLLSIRDWS